MKFLRSIAGIAGSECAALLAIAATAFVMSGKGMTLEVVQFAQGNF
jgi:hypothetical protein